jgi:hypothetical protein
MNATPPNLEALLGRWATVQRLTEARASAVHAAILATSGEASAEARVGQGAEARFAQRDEPRVDLDADWLWDLLRPVTALLDGPNRFNETLSGLISVGA